MSNEEPHSIGEPIEEALLRIIGPDLLEQYQREKERHRNETRQIEQLRKRTIAWIRRTFRSPLRDTKLQEMEREYVERVQGEDDRHGRFMEELRETIRDDGDEGAAEDA